MQSGSCEPAGAVLKVHPPALWYFPLAVTWWLWAAELSLSDAEAEPRLKPGNENFVFMMWLEVHSSWGDWGVSRGCWCAGRVEELWILPGTAEELSSGVAVVMMWLQCFRDAQRPLQNQRLFLCHPFLLADTGIFVASRETGLGKWPRLKLNRQNWVFLA